MRGRHMWEALSLWLKTGEGWIKKKKKIILKKICKLRLGRVIWVSNSSTLHLSRIIINQKNNLSWTKMSHFSYQNKGDDFSNMFSTLQFKNNYFLKLIERVIVWHDTNTKYKPTITISCESNMDENQLLLSIS